MKQRKNITISEAMLERAERVMKARGYDDFSEFVSSLIREEHERRIAPDSLKESSEPPEPPPAAGSITYRNRKLK